MKKVICLLSLVMLAGCSGFPSERVGASDKKSLTPKQEVEALAGDTKAWLDRYEPKLKAAIEGSGFTLERRRNVLAVSMPVQGGFNPDRPQMLMPAKLGPLTRLAKIAEQDADAAVLVLGHADSSGVAEQNLKLSEQRAAAVASIFRLSGLQRDRMLLKGMGSNMPRAANDSAAGRELNRRVEIILTPKNTLVALMHFYSQPAQPTLVADQSSKPKAN